MSFIQVVVFAVVAVVAVIMLRQYNPEIALLLGIGSGVIIILSVLDGLFDVAYTFYNLAEKTGVDSDLFISVLKIVGIGYLTEFTAGVCNDAKAASIGDKVMFAGKICIALVALPLMVDLVKLVIAILPA